MTKTILLVDDARLVLEVEKSLLRRTGANLITASNGAEAIRMAVEHKPDLILLDLILPDLTGDRVCAQIKARPETAEIPVVMVTTKSHESYVERCRQAGCDDYLTKPLHYQELLAKVSRLMRIPHRRSTRVMVRIETHLTQDPETIFGMALDVSETGLFVETNQVLDEGEMVRVRLRLDHDLDLDAQARVVRRQTMLFHKIGYGLHLVGVSDEERERIREFVSHHSDADPPSGP